MEVVGEVVLSVSSSDFFKYAREERLLSDMKKWESKLLEVRAELEDAENKQITKQSVKTWLRDLRDLAYDIDDVLDEFNYHVMTRRTRTTSSRGINKVRRFIPTSGCTAFNPFTCMRNVKIGSKIKDITRRLDEISARKAEFGLDKVAAAISLQPIERERPLATSLVYEPEIFGRDADKQIIINMLLGDDPDLEPEPKFELELEPADQTNVSVVSIVAMGGMGKTTLARLVYDDAEIAKHFNLKAWVCVYDQFDAVRVTKTILNSVVTSTSTSESTSTHDSLLHFNQIQEKLREKLKGKKFMLILDDMWNDNPNDWYCLRAPFSAGARGSKIIVTTRNRRVAEIMGGDKKLHELRELSNEECWLVFKKHSNIDEQSTFASTGKEIVKKCGGLPLAARALGGLLCNEQRYEKWDAILTSPIWKSESNIIPALRLSYSSLSPHLKRCFAYCAIFPKDYEFNKEELMLLWMAEGFIQPSNKGEELEDVGDDYFLELLSKSFFQLSTIDTSQFVMHDLVHDLAKFVSRETCLHLDDMLENDSQHLIYESIRQLSFTSYHDSTYTFERFERFHEKSDLGTLKNIPYGYSYISNKVVKELIPRLEHLRVLSLTVIAISEIPDSFGELKHLRYLNLSCTNIQSLPETIGNLFYLQTLRLLCPGLSKLPN